MIRVNKRKSWYMILNIIKLDALNFLIFKNNYGVIKILVLYNL